MENVPCTHGNTAGHTASFPDDSVSLLIIFVHFFLASKELIDEQEYSRALHVVNETEYTKAFMKHLQNREYKEAGQAMFNSHSSLR